MNTLDTLITEVREIRAALSAIGENERGNRVFDLSAAAKYCGFKTVQNFHQWRKRLRRNPPLHGRYPQPLLDEWLAQECRIRPKK